MRKLEQQIKEATYRLILSKPFRKVTAEQIIAESHVAKATFYAYFTDKYDAALAVFKDKVLLPVSEDEDINLKWSERIEIISKKLIKNKDYCHNLLLVDDCNQMFIRMTKYYCKCFKRYIELHGVDVTSIPMLKAIQNTAQTDFLVIHQYCLGKIKDVNLKRLAACWSETSPFIVHDYI